MSKFHNWRYLIIAISVAIAIIYSIPNFYGESPGIEFVPNKTNKAISLFNYETKINDLILKSYIENYQIIRNNKSIQIKFSSTDDQIKARDLIVNNLEGNNFVALSILSNSPAWLTKLNALPMYLGLDLRGGVHFLLELDLENLLSNSNKSQITDIKKLLKDNKIRYRKVFEKNSKIYISTLDKDAEKAISLINENIATIEFDKRDGNLISYNISENLNKTLVDLALQQNINTLRNRIDELGVSEPIVQQSGNGRIIIQLPGIQDPAKAKDILGRTATLEVRLVDEAATEKLQNNNSSLTSRPNFFYDTDMVPYILKSDVLLTGENISDAQPGFDSQTSEPAVHLRLDSRGSSIFQKTTRDNVGKRIAMVLIEKGEGVIVTAPVVRAEIPGGRVQISGSMNTEEARDISLLLRSGALAVPMNIIEERIVGPSLGKENVDRGILSTWTGLLALAIFIIFYYSLYGIVSVISLVCNLGLLIALLSGLQATLTLPGFAAIALTLGMAIDANVLINERIREEIRNGETIIDSIKNGYDRAWATILDSNITTLIAGIALFSFGSGPIKGFAVVHCLGILTSVFSAVFISRGLVYFLDERRENLSKILIGQSDWYKKV